MTGTPSTTRRSPHTETDRVAAAKARAAKLDALHRQLADQVETLTSSDGWAAMITAAARFRHYSLSNTLLIAAQLHERGMSAATRIAGYSTWNTLGRTVRKGEKGLAIIAPCTYRHAITDDTATAHNSTAGVTSANPTDGAQTLRGFRVAYVFALEQTDGDDLPDAAPALLSGQGPIGLWDALSAAVIAEGYTIERGHCGAANGYTDLASRTVTVRDDVAGAQAVKTLAHELAHVLLHCGDAFDYHGCRDTAEIEAGSIAYLITAAHGLDSAPYTAPYVAGWAAGDVAKVKAAATRVISTAHRILDRFTADTATQPGEVAE